MNKWLLLPIFLVIVRCRRCDECYQRKLDRNCDRESQFQSTTFHMSVHPHLDAYWIFNAQSYYKTPQQQTEVSSYFQSNRFSSVVDIFNNAKKVLQESKLRREAGQKYKQSSHRSFFNSQIGYFKKWFQQRDEKTQKVVKQLLKTKYWQLLGGGLVEHDQAVAYYDDIIENFEIGLHFLKQQFNYYPKISISADTFGHSQTNVAILTHLGIEGFFVERSDEHILLQNKTQFMWKAKSANNKYYGAIPTHIRWAIHGFEDQFLPKEPDTTSICSKISKQMMNLRNQNKFLKQILKSNHIMRYFGHDFQKFDDYSYQVIQTIMEEYSRAKCHKEIAVYTNPTEYFTILIGEVFSKVKPIKTRSQDIMPIWDYDSGLYWTGFYTTDPFHKKQFRDMGRFLRGVRKAYARLYIESMESQAAKQNYELLQIFAEQVGNLQHHDGITGTSKYTVMDQLQEFNQKLISNVTNKILSKVYESQYPINTNNAIFYCNFGDNCSIPANQKGDIFLKIFNSGANRKNQDLIVQLPYNQYYVPNDCPYEMYCFCQEMPCNCKLYLLPKFNTFMAIRLRKVDKVPEKYYKLKPFQQDQQYSYNSTHFKITVNYKIYWISYLQIKARQTTRSYKHLDRYGDQIQNQLIIRSGKYALGNDPNQINRLSKIRKVYTLKSPRHRIILIKWERQGMKTMISINLNLRTQWKVETLSAASGEVADLYLQVGSQIKNDNVFYTDSNGWLVMRRELFHHEDYKAHFEKQKYDDVDGNTYPITAFCYIQDDKDKISVNTDRGQGVISYIQGTIWLNFDRITQDDGKWLYQQAYRSQYQKFTHVISVQNTNYNERLIQMRYDQPVFMQVNLILPNEKIPNIDNNNKQKLEWEQFAGLQDLKFTIKALNESKVILRVHNLHDKKSKSIVLFTDDNISPILVAYFGVKVSFKSIQQMSLGANMKYKQFLQRKWNLQSIIDLTQENQIFNKVFQQTIELRPLEIRTFQFSEVSFSSNCPSMENLKMSQKPIKYSLNVQKPIPQRQDTKLEELTIKYLLKGDHCKKMKIQNQDIAFTNLNDIQDQQNIDKQKNDQPIQNNENLNSVPPPPSPPQKPKQQKIAQQDKKLIDQPTNIKQKSLKSQANKFNIKEQDLLQFKVSRVMILTKEEKQKYFRNKLRKIKAATN